MGVGGGVGWNASKSRATSSSGRTMEGYFNNLMGDQLGGANNEIFNQFLAMLTSGQVGTSAQPIVTAAQNASKAAAAQTNKQTGQSLATSGLAGTPFGEMVKAQTYQTGAQATADAGTEAFQNILQQFMQYVAGLQGSAVSGLAGVSPGTTTGTSSGVNVKGQVGGK